MAFTMNSPLGFTSTVKLPHTRFSGYSSQHLVWAKSSIQKLFFVEAPLVQFLGSRSSGRDVKRGKIPFATDSNRTVAESGMTESSETKTATPTGQIPSSNVQPNVNDGEKTSPQVQDTMPKKSPLTARERLRAARVLSRYTESKPSKPELGRSVLDALRESDKGKKRSGLPEAPENLFDDSKRGLPKDGFTFNLPVGSDLFFVIFSFVFISTIMFATTFIVWKVGAIHFNEY